MRRRIAVQGWMIGLACAAAAALMAVMLVHCIDVQMQEQELELLSGQIRRAAISCYASEGRYPQDIDYLVENYGLIYDDERYNVMFDAFASNIMPDISVSVRGDDLL